MNPGGMNNILYYALGQYKKYSLNKTLLLPKEES